MSPQTTGTTPESSPQRCGLLAIVGRPNVGKSTLLNALVGQKISITSRKAQTTRHRITGMHTQGASQYVFVDTPGFQTRHSTALNKSLNKTVMGAVGDVDLVLFVVEAGNFTLADAKVLSLLKPGIPVLLIANKLDLVHRRSDLLPWLQADVEEMDEVFGADPWPYGIEANRPTLEALVGHMVDQHYIARPIPLEELFVVK